MASRALGSSTKGTSAATAKCQMVHLGSRNHGQSSDREQAARARLVVSCALRQLDLNIISELWRQLNISIKKLPDEVPSTSTSRL